MNEFQSLKIISKNVCLCYAKKTNFKTSVFVLGIRPKTNFKKRLLFGYRQPEIQQKMPSHMFDTLASGFTAESQMDLLEEQRLSTSEVCVSSKFVAKLKDVLREKIVCECEQHIWLYYFASS